MSAEPRGEHVIADYTNYFTRDPGGSGHAVLKIMRTAVEEASNATIVGELLSVFDGSDSPLGFASVLLLDESHMTAHCYSNEGLLAVDCFTCGGAQPTLILDHFETAIKEIAPEIKIGDRKRLSRFLSN